MQAYDGFYFLPLENESGLNFVFFDIEGESAGGEKVEYSDIGDKYHILFFSQNDKNELDFDSSFEAILGDPVSYIESLIGVNLFGCVVRKTTKSNKWLDSCLKRTSGGITLNLLRQYIKGLLR